MSFTINFLAAFVFINFLLYIPPKMFPEIFKLSDFLPYQAWFNFLFLFTLFLPKKVGNFFK